jgi:predicted membrane protein
MQSRRTFSFNSNQNPFNSLLSLLVFIGVLALLFFLVKGFITILYWVAPVLLIATLIINYKVVGDYMVDLTKTFQRDILWGIVKTAFTILCYPLVIGWLFVKAIFMRNINKMKKEFDNQMNVNTNTQYIDYEEINPEDDKKNKTNNEPPIELPKPKERERKNPYDNLFDT